MSGDEPARPRGRGQAEFGFELRELLLAPDERPVVPAGDAFGLPDRQQSVRRHGLGLALQGEGLDRLHVDRVADEPVGRLADEDLQRGRGLLESRGDVDRVPGDEPLPGRRIACNDLSGVHPSPVLEPDAPALLDLVVQIAQRLLHRKGGTHGPEGILFVDPREPEDGHDRVADVLLDAPAVLLEDRLHLLEVAGHDLAERLRVEGFAEVRRALEIGEDDRDRLPHLLRRELRCELCPAKTAETEPGGILLATVWANLHKSSVRRRDAVAKGGASSEEQRRRPRP